MRTQHRERNDARFERLSSTLIALIGERLRCRRRCCRRHVGRIIRRQTMRVTVEDPDGFLSEVS